MKVESVKSKRELISLLEVLDRHEESLERDKLSRYVPHGNGPDGGQLAFHKSDALIRLIISGNRFGKSLASIIECIWLANGLHPYHPISVPNRGKLYGDSYPMIMENIFLKIQEWAPKHLLHPSKPFTYSNAGMLTGVNWANGSITRIGSYDQEERKAEGTNWNYIAFDEPPSRDLYVANMRGLVDTGGLMWFSMTPLSEKWIYDDLWVPGLSGEKKHIACFRGTSADNPHINKQALEIFLSELTDDEKDVRFYGHFKRLQGLVIDTYDPDLSDVDPFDLNENYVIYEGIDPHPMKPHCALWKAIDRDNYRYVVEELVCPGGIREFGQKIAEVRRRLTAHGAVFAKSVCDTFLNQTEMRSRLNLRDELMASLRDEGESSMPYNAMKKDNLLPTIQKVKDLYRPVVQRRSETDEIISDKPMPMQYVFKNCRRYKYELTHYQWSEKLHDNSKPVPKDDDLLSCDRYIETVSPNYHTPGQRFIESKTKGAYHRVKGHNLWLR